MRKEDLDAALSALSSIHGSLSKYSIRKPGASPQDESSEPVAEESAESESPFLTLDDGEEEMPEGAPPHDEEVNDSPEASPMRMLDYGPAQARKAVAPGGSRMGPPLNPSSTPFPAGSPVKRGRGRPRKVL